MMQELMLSNIYTNINSSCIVVGVRGCSYVLIIIISLCFYVISEV